MSANNSAANFQEGIWRPFYGTEDKPIFVDPDFIATKIIEIINEEEEEPIVIDDEFDVITVRDEELDGVKIDLVRDEMDGVEIDLVNDDEMDEVEIDLVNDRILPGYGVEINLVNDDEEEEECDCDPTFNPKRQLKVPENSVRKSNVAIFLEQMEHVKRMDALNESIKNIPGTIPLTTTPRKQIATKSKRALKKAAKKAKKHAHIDFRRTRWLNRQEKARRDTNEFRSNKIKMQKAKKLAKESVVEEEKMDPAFQWDDIKTLAEELCEQFMFSQIHETPVEGLIGQVKGYSDLYLAGSFVSSCVARARDILSGKRSYEDPTNPWVPQNNDYDIYSCNKMALMHAIPGLMIHKSKMDSVNVKFTDVSEVLTTYDCLMNKCSYHPYSGKLTGYGDEYVAEMIKHSPHFPVRRLTTDVRFTKIVDRSINWFGGYVTLTPDADKYFADGGSDDHDEQRRARKEQRGTHRAGVICIKKWFGNRTCVGCKLVFESDFNKCFMYHAYVCNDCYRIAAPFLKSALKNTQKEVENMKVVVFGGATGIGKVIVTELVKGKWGKVTATTRNLRTMMSKDFVCGARYMSYNIKEGEMSDPAMIEAVTEADVVIFNAWPTVEGDINNWNHDISQFPFNTFVDDRVPVITGFVKFVNQYYSLVEAAQFKSPKHRSFVMMDADESKYVTGKLMTGSHLMCNMAKGCQKMVLGTCTEQLAFLNVKVEFFNPGWMSVIAPAQNEHMIDYENGKARSMEYKIHINIKRGKVLVVDDNGVTTPHNNGENAIYVKPKNRTAYGSDSDSDSNKPDETVEELQSEAVLQRAEVTHKFLCRKHQNTKMAVRCLIYGITCCAGTEKSFSFMKRTDEDDVPMFPQMGKDSSYYKTLERICQRKNAVTVEALREHISESPNELWKINAGMVDTVPPYVNPANALPETDWVRVMHHVRKDKIVTEEIYNTSESERRWTLAFYHRNQMFVLRESEVEKEQTDRKNMYLRSYNRQVKRERTREARKRSKLAKIEAKKTKPAPKRKIEVAAEDGPVAKRTRSQTKKAANEPCACGERKTTMIL